MEYKKSEEGKCETCGFFSKHGQGISAPTPRFYEVERSQRTNYNEIFAYFSDNRQFTCDIACFRHKVDFMREIKRLPSESDHPKKLVEMVRLDRHCDQWWPYTPGFSPMEHYAEFNMQRLEQERRNYENRIEGDRRRYEEAMAETAEVDRRRFELSQRRQDRTLIIVGLILAAAQIVAAFILASRESFSDQILRHIFGR